MEGGFQDRKGKPLHTLQDYLAGKAPYVSVAMDSKSFPYGQKLRIPELEKKYGRPIEFRVVDTGGAFKGKGTSRIDICTANRKASLDPTVNGKLTLVPQK
jgi:3D (Asp-Asp-Asp) domain-containing protein